jgi:hypothetical protein
MLAGQNLCRVFNFRRGRAFAPCASFVTEKRSSLKWKMRSKQLLGSLPLAFALTATTSGEDYCPTDSPANQQRGEGEGVSPAPRLTGFRQHVACYRSRLRDSDVEMFRHPADRNVSLWQGSLTKGKGSIQSASSYWFSSAAFCNKNNIYSFYKTSYLNEEVNRTEPFHLASIPCLWSLILSLDRTNYSYFCSILKMTELFFNVYGKQQQLSL